MNPTPTPPLLLGHRGARGDRSVPENTLAAFDFALAQGCDGFEFDVRLTADGQAVVGHDPVFGGSNISESSSQSLTLPLLRGVLARYQRTAFLDIELKVGGLEQITADLLREFTPVRGVVVSSFLPEVIRTLYKLDSSIPLGLICETQTQLNLWSGLPVEFVIPHYKLLRRDVLRKLQTAGKRVLVWTLNAPFLIKRFATWGVDGIISDDPLQLALRLNAAGPRRS